MFDYDISDHRKHNPYPLLPFVGDDIEIWFWMTMIQDKLIELSQQELKFLYFKIYNMVISEA